MQHPTMLARVAEIVNPGSLGHGPLDESGFTFTATGLIIEPWVTYEQWENYGRKLQLAEKGIQWALGDWMIHGEKNFKEMAAQAVEFTGLKIKTLQNYATVAERVDKSRRRDSDLVDFTTHAEVASLSAKDQERILAKAEQEALSSRDVRREVHKAKREAGKVKSEIEILHTPEVQLFLSQYLEVLTGWEERVPLTATFLRGMFQEHKSQANWQKERTIADDCDVILMAIDETGGLSDDDMFKWLRDRGYFMSDPELDERLEYMEKAEMILEDSAGKSGKLDKSRGSQPSFWVRFYKKRQRPVIHKKCGEFHRDDEECPAKE